MDDDQYGTSNPRKNQQRRNTKRPQGRRGPRSVLRGILEEGADPADLTLTDDQTELVRQRAMNSCMWYLERSDKTRAELVKVLTAKQCPQPVIDTVLDRLEELGLVNDARYAEQFVTSRREYRKYGTSRIRSEMRRKGFDPDVIDEALTDDPEGERSSARELAESKMRSLAGLEPGKQTTRLVGLLARKGFPPGVVYEVAREVIQEHAQHDTDD